MRYQLNEKKALAALLLLMGAFVLIANTTVLAGPVQVSEKGAALLLIALGALTLSIRLFRKARVRY
ncbi:MAG: hypothetical protein EOO11_13835 [Chitinophagaceae bacterium]|nr:MAG: hypothetical protein EOO11_13835 [Chitinophagaceae bacterium]